MRFQNPNQENCIYYSTTVHELFSCTDMTYLASEMLEAIAKCEIEHCSDHAPVHIIYRTRIWRSVRDNDGQSHSKWYY